MRTVSVPFTPAGTLDDPGCALADPLARDGVAVVRVATEFDDVAADVVVGRDVVTPALDDRGEPEGRVGPAEVLVEPTVDAGIGVPCWLVLQAAVAASTAASTAGITRNLARLIGGPRSSTSDGIRCPDAVREALGVEETMSSFDRESFRDVRTW